MKNNVVLLLMVDGEELFSPCQRPLANWLEVITGCFIPTIEGGGGVMPLLSILVK